jgi:hypothetical protein
MVRLFKEEKTYHQETEQARKRLQKFKDDGADGADIRNAVSSPVSVSAAFCLNTTARG